MRDRLYWVPILVHARRNQMTVLQQFGLRSALGSFVLPPRSLSSLSLSLKEKIDHDNRFDSPGPCLF